MSSSGHPNLTYDLGSLLAIDAAPPFTKSVDSSKLTITSVLTQPEHDKAGDFVHPAGGNFAPHQADPWIGLEHYRWDKAQKEWVYPEEKNASADPVVIAWARDSLAEPGGTYSVRMADLNLKGVKHSLPVATSYFDPNDKLSMQVFALVADDTLPGVSMEFRPAAPKWSDGRLHKSYRPLGPSPIENRPALEIFNWDFHGFVHCRTPVNDGALTVAPEKLVKAVQVGKVGGESMHPMLLKSMSAVVPSRRYFTVSNALIKKADMLPDESLADTSVYDDPAAADASPAEGSQTEPGNYPTADGLRMLAQTLTDACEAAKQVKGEHKKGMKALRKLCDKVEAMVQEAVATAANVDADLEDDADAEVEATEDEAAEVETDLDDEGILKCLPERFKLIVKAKRFKMSEIREAESGNTEADKNYKALEAKKLRRVMARA